MKKLILTQKTNGGEISCPYCAEIIKVPEHFPEKKTDLLDGKTWILHLVAFVLIIVLGSIGKGFSNKEICKAFAMLFSSLNIAGYGFFALVIGCIEVLRGGYWGYKVKSFHKIYKSPAILRACALILLGVLFMFVPSIA